MMARCIKPDKRVRIGGGRSTGRYKNEKAEQSLRYEVFRTHTSKIVSECQQPRNSITGFAMTS